MTEAPPSTLARVLHPDIRIILHKMVKRSTVDGTLPVAARFTDSDRTLDLTPFVSDLAGMISTTKNIRSPAGTFSLTFADAPYGQAATLESLYGLIEPMDGIEIRASHNHTQASRVPPILMRGFVSAVTRSQQMNTDGAPVRTVTVEGHDYGKIWQMLQVLYRPFNTMGEVFLSNFRLFERFGLALTNRLGKDLVADVIAEIINPHLETMLPSDWPMPRTIGVQALAEEGMVSVTGSQNYEGRIYDLLAYFCDVSVGFNELFIEDRADEVVAVFRPNPALDLAEVPIQPFFGSPDMVPYRVAIPGEDIVGMTLTRTDNDVANYFWVDDARHELVLPLPQAYAAATSAQRATVFMEDYPNNLPTIYGLRPMIVATQMGASSTFHGGRSASENAQRQQQTMNWLHERRRILAATNRDNAVFEQGSIRIAGNENVRAGSYVVIGEGALAAPFYVVAVQHDIIPFRGYFTTLFVERGMGFAKRIQSAGAVAPYLLDLGAGEASRSGPSTTPFIGQTGQAGTTQGGAGAPQGPAPSTQATGR